MHPQQGWLPIDFGAEVALDRKLGEGGFGCVWAARCAGAYAHVSGQPFAWCEFTGTGSAAQALHHTYKRDTPNWPFAASDGGLALERGRSLLCGGPHPGVRARPAHTRRRHSRWRGELIAVKLVPVQSLAAHATPAVPPAAPRSPAATAAPAVTPAAGPAPLPPAASAQTGDTGGSGGGSGGGGGASKRGEGPARSQQASGSATAPPATQLQARPSWSSAGGSRGAPAAAAVAALSSHISASSVRAIRQEIK
jgi:hypothetical protein